MPTFDNFATSQTTKMLFIGHSGTGKTGASCSLAAAGYNVRILDLDKGVEVISDYLNNPKSLYLRAKDGVWTTEQAKTIKERMSFVSLDEGMVLQAGNIIPKGDLWTKIGSQLTEWKDGEAKFGNVSTWGPKDVLIIDGLSRLAQAAFNYQLKMNARLNGRPEQSDYWNAQQLVLRLLMLLYSSEVKCNVIMICHISFIETKDGPTRGFAQSIGKALSPQIGQFFNHALLAKASGQGENVKRIILTNTSGMVDLKSAAPLRVKPEYSLETGLAEYFRDVRGETK
jgi:AAA domain